MTAPLKKRLCWNCEGRVPHSDEHCPFCGVYLSGTLDMQSSALPDEDDDEHDLAPIPPAYIPEEQQVEAAMQQASTSDVETSLEAPSVRNEFLPLSLLVIGSVFLIFSLVLLFFSHDGVLKLQWDASLWFIYLAISIPSLLLGWNYFKKIQ